MKSFPENEGREVIMERLDMCDAVKLHQVSFVLNPSGEWESFPAPLKTLVEQPWIEFKYFLDDTGQINPAISSVPNNCGGIYAFLIKPNIIPDAHLYLAYIGRARKTTYQNLRKRVREYATEEGRLKIANMKRLWSPYLYVRYLALPEKDNDCIDELEKELIKTVLPPFNDQYPEVYNQAMSAAF